MKRDNTAAIIHSHTQKTCHQHWVHNYSPIVIGWIIFDTGQTHSVKLSSRHCHPFPFLRELTLLVLHLPPTPGWHIELRCDSSGAGSLQEGLPPNTVKAWHPSPASTCMSLSSCLLFHGGAIEPFILQRGLVFTDLELLNSQQLLQILFSLCFIPNHSAE